ncbi:MAG: SsrA-binding protein [Candidatus Nomurabacteria bacterium GW2011_GWB1_37_5]|uniref:SsrA-binding protein n=1 Tax=Candidatus Nomurabacteria bacterium GW2011_GWB1_37_5 TaxID=1618742 RepID=A0A0G0H7X9_9BACT|nr:MAG: SsrA-binding protein [Candidatus Nomurabacteria bacterium GW2011_GWB1_37_5]
MPTLIENKKARFDYEILEKFDAGIELQGFEVKSIKNNQGKLEGAFVIIRGGEAYLMGVQIPPYQAKNTPPQYDPLRNRKLLLTKKEIAELLGKEKAKGLTIIPISMYTKGRKIKVSLAVVKGKKKFDKRETIKKRETEREIRREMRHES